MLTPTNIEDREPLRKFAERLHRSLRGDKRYTSKDIREALGKQGYVNLVYKVRPNMKPLDLSVSDEVLLKKRMLIESVIRELKTQTALEHSPHRSFENFQVNVFSALIAYQGNQRWTCAFLTTKLFSNSRFIKIVQTFVELPGYFFSGL